MAQQLRDACRKWLLAEPRDVEGVIDLVVLEQFVARLPRRTAEWVQCHRPTSLAQAIQLAEDHLSPCPGVGEPRPNLSLSLSLPPSLPSPSLSRPLPAPRSRLPVAPRAPPRSGQGQLREGQSDRYPQRGGGPEPTTSPQYSLRQSLAHPSAAGAAVRPGPACWRCGDPGHFQDQCPMMEVGLLVRVPDSTEAAPDQAGQERRRGPERSGEALAGPAPPASGETRASEGVRTPELDDFPLEQSRDETLKNAYDRVRSIDGQLLRPDVPLSYPYFSLIKERLYRVTQEAQSKEITTQL